MYFAARFYYSRNYNQMIKKLSVTLQSFIFIILWSIQGHTQQVTPDDKLRFRNSIKKVKVWTRIANDTALGYYVDALNAVKTELNRKGYRVEQVFFDKSVKLSPRRWERQMIDSLAPDEAFLDMMTRVELDTTHVIYAPDRVIEHVAGDGGAVIAYYNASVIPGDVKVGYKSFVKVNFYISWKKDSTGTFVPLFSKKYELASGDISLAVKSCLSRIPRSLNPVEIPVNEIVSGNEKTRLEITGFAGYVFPSSMDINSSASTTKGTIAYNPGAHYGVDVSFSISRSIDVFAMYDREDTKFTINTPVKFPDDALSASINYILVGAVKNFRVTRFVSPFISLSVGSVNTTPKNNFYREVWYFAVSPQAGIKLYLSKWIGLRFQTYCLYQIHPMGAPFLYSMNVYSSEWDSYSNMLQFGLSAGIILRIGAAR